MFSPFNNHFPSRRKELLHPNAIFYTALQNSAAGKNVFIPEGIFCIKQLFASAKTIKQCLCLEGKLILFCETNLKNLYIYTFLYVYYIYRNRI